MDIQSEELIPDLEAKSILEAKEKEGELKYEQKNALETLRKSVKLTAEKTTALLEDLKRIEKLRDRQIISIVNFLPEDRDDLRAVLHKDYTTLTDDEINKILETIKNHV